MSEVAVKTEEKVVTKKFRKTAKKKEEFLTSLFESSEDGQIRMKVEDFEYAGNQCIS